MFIGGFFFLILCPQVSSAILLLISLRPYHDGLSPYLLIPGGNSFRLLKTLYEARFVHRCCVLISLSPYLVVCLLRGAVDMSVSDDPEATSPYRMASCR